MLSLRHFTSNKAKLKDAVKECYRMTSWVIDSYGDLSEFRNRSIRIPVLRCQNDVLIKVHAVSVNPIDLLMVKGYGKTLLQIPRRFDIEFPLILGRDFCGTIVSKGHGVGDAISVGQLVYGFIPLHKQGSFSEYVVADKEHVLPKPPILNIEESAAVVYATMTAWSALFIFGNLLTSQKKGLRVLILGGSGGVGTCAIQLLKSQGCVVFATCATDAVSLVQSVGADHVFDYKDDNFLQNVSHEGKYHIILDAAQFGIENIPRNWHYDSFITLNSPLLINTDKFGLCNGLIRSANTLVNLNLDLMRRAKFAKWGFFLPSNCGFEFINKLICSGKIKPVVYKKFNFQELPVALKTLSEGHTRGKIVVTYQ